MSNPTPLSTDTLLTTRFGFEFKCAPINSDTLMVSVQGRVVTAPEVAIISGEVFSKLGLFSSPM